MRHISIEPPAFFHRGPTPIARLAFFGLISIALLFVDTRYPLSRRHPPRRGGRPLSAAARAQLPGELVSDIGSYFRSLQALTEENTSLKRSSSSARRPRRDSPSRSRRNARLRTLIDVSSRYAAGATAVEVLYSSRDPFAQRLYVGKGVDAELHPVKRSSTPTGWSGRSRGCFRAWPKSRSSPTRITQVPVKVQRSGVRSVLYGSGAGRAPELRFMAPSRTSRSATRS
jgi:rod shape-determining protein MreC